MIADGYGWEYTYNLPYKYQKEFKEAMSNAEKNNLGLRSSNACN
jgi:micrococcal nuclease